MNGKIQKRRKQFLSFCLVLAMVFTGMFSSRVSAESINLEASDPNQNEFTVYTNTDNVFGPDDTITLYKENDGYGLNVEAKITYYAASGEQIGQTKTLSSKLEQANECKWSFKVDDSSIQHTSGYAGW